MSWWFMFHALLLRDSHAELVEPDGHALNGEEG
jgi:hypothetical protein